MRTPRTTRSPRRMDEDLPLLETDPLQGAAPQAYDLVLNGVELGGGSIRIHDRDVQREVFRLLGHQRRGGADARSASSWTPCSTAPRRTAASPSGSTAWSCCSAGTDTIRDVIAFPKTPDGGVPDDQAPSPVEAKQLKELRVRLG